MEGIWENKIGFDVSGLSFGHSYIFIAPCEEKMRKGGRAGSVGGRRSEEGGMGGGASVRGGGGERKVEERKREWKVVQNMTPLTKL